MATRLKVWGLKVSILGLQGPRKTDLGLEVDLRASKRRSLSYYGTL